MIGLHFRILWIRLFLRFELPPTLVAATSNASHAWMLASVISLCTVQYFTVWVIYITRDWLTNTDLDLHCLQRQGISGFSRTKIKEEYSLIILGIFFLFRHKKKTYGVDTTEYPQHMLSLRTWEKYPIIITKYTSLTSPLLLHVLFVQVYVSRSEGQLSVSGERMCTILVNRLED